jgi:hypothetical protein
MSIPTHERVRVPVRVGMVRVPGAQFERVRVPSVVRAETERCPV